MKKVFLAFGILAVLVAFSSCSKTCTCKQSIGGQVMNTTTMETKGKCSDLNFTQTTMGMTQKTECENE
jgi:hypothetical protein